MNNDNPANVKRSDLLREVQEDVHFLVARINQLPQALGREAGGAEGTLAKRKLQEAAYWLGEAEELAKLAGE